MSLPKGFSIPYTLGGNVLFTEELYGKLTAWVNKHYRDKLAPEDLLDINLHTESLAALKELYEILNLKD